MLRRLSILVTVPDKTRNDTSRVRVVGLVDDGATLAVAQMVAGAGQAEVENEFRIDEVVRLAEACLSGDRRALTTPGLARYLCGGLVVLAKAARQAGALVDELPEPEIMPDAAQDDDEAGADD